MANLKGFIKDKNGNIILPISRGELIFDASGNCAFHSEVFKALPEDANSTEYPDGRYGLMRPADLKDIADAKAKIATIELQIGGSGETSISSEIASLKLRVDAAEDIIKNLKNDIGNPTDGIAEGSPTNTIYALINTINSEIGSKNDTSPTTVYGYINSEIDKALTSALEYKGTINKPDGSFGEGVSLPAINSAKNGDVWKVEKAGVYQGKSAKIGDLFIARKGEGTTSEWTYVPSGDETETFIKADGANTALSDTVIFKAGKNSGIIITLDTANNTITISGNGGDLAEDLTEITKRIEDLETDVTNLKNSVGSLTETVGRPKSESDPATGLIKDIDDLKNEDLNLNLRLSAVENTLGKEAEGTKGDPDYKDATGIVKDVRDLQNDVNNAVTTPNDLINPDNGNNLVRASAVAETARNLASHITAYEAKVNEIESKYLYAETLYGDEPLTTTHKSYLILSNKPVTPST